ncbi:MAG: transporter permease, partial [Alphaproteobacteria bacterium]|nr:transporter permease [Alphaproteobacteria bacterium]
MAQFTETLSDASPVTLKVTGNWVLDNLAAIQKELKDVPEKDIQIQADIQKLDTAGAQLLNELAGDKEIQGLQEWQTSLITLVKNAAQEFPASEEKNTLKEEIFIATGKATIEAWESIKDLLRFIGETTIMLGNVITHPQRMRGISVIRHINETGVAAIPIVSLIAFLISIVLAYQGADQLRRFGAEIFTINMVAVSVLREMGVLLTAIMIAGRSGSAFTAEIGVMKVNEEVDAMRIIGITPFEILVLPRLLALLITLPLLTFIADIMGLIGG